MILISHRGNINGRIEVLENKPDYIDSAIIEGFEVEVDVWYINNNLYLGHDTPQYLVNFEWFEERLPKLWIHCKNVDSIVFFKSSNTKFNFFWHESDTVTLTSHNEIWAHPGKQPINNSIAVLPELYNDKIDKCKGVCSDYIKNFL